jgi:ATP-dependent DNA helicase RecG
MEAAELIELVNKGEDSKAQFKSNVNNETSLAREMVAFSNSGGGRILIGIDDDGSINGLTQEDIHRLNQLISNAASQQVRPPINPITENILTPDGLVLVVTIPDGFSKPYMDKDGIIWVKNGADKRKATAREEIQRLYQSACLIHGDEIPVQGTSVADVDIEYFSKFFEKNFDERLEDQEIPLNEILHNMNLMKDGMLNIAGTLLFAKNSNFKLPMFIVKAVAFPGNDFHESEYLDSRDIEGKIETQFHESKSFIHANLRHIQRDRGVNSVGELEIPPIVFEELIANALIHRDYFISAPIRIFAFSNRVEIVSPGHLPNHLTIENIKSGNSNIRNPILASFATKILPYRGLGSGIVRALKAYPHINFEDDKDGNIFKVTIWREVDG